MSTIKLYNGIVLPEVWPPQYPLEMFAERKALPVPYLEDPPEVIPLGIGRELFVDDFLIEKTTCRRSFHYPEKYANNPVLKPETELELGQGRLPSCACPKSGGVWYDYEKIFINTFSDSFVRAGFRTEYHHCHWYGAG